MTWRFATLTFERQVSAEKASHAFGFVRQRWPCEQNP